MGIVDVQTFLDQARDKLEFGEPKQAGEGATSRTIMDIFWDGGELKMFWPQGRWSGLYLDKNNFDKKDDKSAEEKKPSAPSYSMTYDLCSKDEVQNLPEGARNLLESEKLFSELLLAHLDNLKETVPDKVPAKMAKALGNAGMREDIVKPLFTHPNTEKSRNTQNKVPDTKKPKRSYLKARQWDDGNFSVKFMQEIDGELVRVQDPLEKFSGRDGAGGLEPCVKYETVKIKDYEVSTNLKPTTVIVEPSGGNRDEEELAALKGKKYAGVSGNKPLGNKPNPNNVLKNKAVSPKKQEKDDDASADNETHTEEGDDDGVENEPAKETPAPSSSRRGAGAGGRRARKNLDE